ncbi:SDR family oxidoreductase [Nocardia tengchongensis]|uniref:SDR family oxidoreductase n=1 Tax=Nocardia tengchongensis TaxID=2055889 RepID=UPI0036BC61DD
MAATLADPAVIDYSAAKAALTNTAKSLSKQLGPNGIRVNTISPEPVATDLWLGDAGVAHATGGNADSVAESAAAASVTGRFSRLDEIANLAVFLASPRAANITSCDFAIDGGLLTTT